MLTPKQLDNLPQSMIELYSKVEMDIIADMASRISAYNTFIPSAEWQYKKLIEMGSLHDDILKKLAAASKLSKKELARLMEEAGVEAITIDSAIYKKAGLSPPLLNASPDMLSVLSAGLSTTNGLFENLTRTTANTATKQFENALDRAWLQINSGAFSSDEAIRMAVKDLASRGLASVTYPFGRTDYLETAVRRATLTGINQTSLKLQETLADEMDSDLVEVTAHSGARTGEGVANHADWQGKIYSRSGKHIKYPSLREKTGYGTGEGLGGWNCRHSFFPFIEGVSEPVYTQTELEELQAPKLEYNGKALTEEDALKKQRYIESNIRRYKREFNAMEAAGLSTAESAVALSKWQAIEKDFLSQTGLKKQYSREWVNGFGKSEAQKAVQAQKRVYNTAKSVLSKENIPESIEKFNELAYNANGELLKELSSLSFSDALKLKPLYNNRVARSWYITQNKQIPSLIDKSMSYESQARQAFTIRSLNKENARTIMRSESDKKQLDADEPIGTFEDMVKHKISKYGLNGDDIYKDIIRSSATTRKNVNQKFGLE